MVSKGELAMDDEDQKLCVHAERGGARVNVKQKIIKKGMLAVHNYQNKVYQCSVCAN
jgi:hypothetical protein